MEKGWSSSVRLRITEPGYECRRYPGLLHSLTFLMGLPMRYPRFFIVWFVALGLAASSAAAARADHTGARSGEQAYAASVFEIVDQAVLGGDPDRRSEAVEFLADVTDLGGDGVGKLLDAVAELVLTVADTGQRTGVLAIPEVNQLIAEVLGPPTDTDVPATVVDLSERRSEADNLPSASEAAATDADEEAVAKAAADPVERWRPLVERYFPVERVGEALSIIDCESNGDPFVSNPRSSAAGLFQFISGTWEHASEQAGFGGSSPLDPEANVAAAAWLVAHSVEAGRPAWAHWTCRP